MKNIWFLSLLILLTVLSSCENEPISKADPSKVIKVGSELYNLIERAAGNDFDNEITCIDFNYAFTLIIYDENMDIFGYQIIKSDIEFSEFLGALEEDKSISLSYPITSILNDGQPYTINNNEELKEAIDQCLGADTVITCNKNAFGGTWVSYFIEDELHLNIFLTGNENVSDDWNFDWKITSFDPGQIQIENGTDRIFLIKDCYEPCRKILFEECETEPNSGRAIFELESYFECFFPFSGISNPETVTWSYYENYEDMLEGINPITNLMYENTENPQVIYVRFDDIITGVQVSGVPIVLKAINCF